MKRIIYALLLISIIIFSGCTSNKITRDIPDDLVQLREFDFDEGKVTGTDDERTISFEPVEVKPGLMLERTITIKESEGAKWTINLDSSNYEGEYTHIENIPKSFAQDVSQIKFSIEPDIIIDPDPSVAWIKNISKGVKTSLKVNIAWSYLTGGIDGTDGKILAIVEHFDDVRLFVGLENCQLADGDFGRMLCMIDLLGKHPDKFTIEHCKGLSDIDYSTREMQACRAYLNKDINECQEVKETTVDLDSSSKMITNTKEEEIDNCKFLAFLTGYSSCLNKDTQMQKDECIIKQAVWAEYVGGCERISNILPYQRCIAQINQDDDACIKLMNYKNMFSEDDYISCCNLLEEESYQSRCIEYVSDEKESEKEESCEEVYGADEYYLNLCYEKKAKDECDINYCYKIEANNDVKIEQCIMQMLCGVDDCLLIKSDMKYQCIWYNAKTPEDCALIGDEVYRPFSSTQYYSQETCNTREKWPADVQARNAAR